MFLGLVVATTTACNVFDHELPGSGVPMDAQSPDSDADPVLGCDLTKPFAGPVLVDGIASSSQDASIRLSPDEKTAYFFSARSSAQLLYSAQRDRVPAPFGNVTALANVNTGNQYNPAITADGLTLYFASDRPAGLGSNDIYQASRSTATGDFSNVRLAPNVNTAASEVQPYVTRDGTAMYFTRTVGTRTVIFRAIGSVAAGFANPASVPEIAGPTNDSDPVLSAAGLTLYWSSDRLGGSGLDVWQAHRATTADAFTDLTSLVSVNSGDLDAPNDISADGCRLYLTSARDGRVAIYVATRPP